MTKFVSHFKVYQFLDMPDLPHMYWSIGSAWLMFEHIWDLVKKCIGDIVKAARFIAVTADETSIVDNTSWIVIHVYVMHHWCRVSHLYSLQKMESNGATTNNLTETLMGALSVNCGLEAANIASKLIFFGADGASTFQGSKNGVVKQIKDKHASFVVGVHCCTHKLNLCTRSLSSLTVMHAIENVLQATHSYFAHSPKKVIEFRTLAQLMETKGLKLLKNVKTRWISYISPLRRLINEFKTVLAKMHADKDDKKSGKKATVTLLIHTFHFCKVSWRSILVLFESLRLCKFLYILDVLVAISLMVVWGQMDRLFSRRWWILTQF
jgi:hypothetical protein